MKPIAQADLNHILDHTRDLWEEARGERFFITGGTGFFGAWLLESFAWINRRLDLKANAAVLSRNPASFLQRMPHLAHLPDIQFIKGDVRDFEFPLGSYKYVVHAATESSVILNDNDPQRMFDTIVEGTHRTIEFASSHEASKFLLTSSGAVYGKQPPEISRIPEDYRGAPDPLDPHSAYGEGKRAAELLCSLAAPRTGIQMKIARCFAFVGPHLPLDAHFAIGNFIRDAMAGGPIIVKGDGTPYRSYLYAADLAVWLWTILFRSQSCRPYNVGSDMQISIRDLAYQVRDILCPDVEVKIAQPAQTSALVERYVPSIEQAKDQLGLRVWISLEEAITKTSR